MKTEAGSSVKAFIQCLKNGAFSWVSASGFHISVAGLLGAAGFVFALKKDGKFGNFSGFPWLTERDTSLEKRVYLAPGLQNVGNNCFLNVILQALASCTYFKPFLQKVMEECEEHDENMPLTVALAALLEELCLVAEGRVVLSPREVMLALELYVQNFNLTSQQDAAEAFLHLLSSLREEFSDCYSPNQSSLVDAVATQNFRILSPKKSEDQSEQERWQKHFFGPFDGILTSILTCQSCSSQISLDYQFFHSLPLSPVLHSGSSIMFGCTLEDCLKQFVIAEQVENYRCNHCWHIAGIKYLSAMGATEMEIERLRTCSAQDSCDCRNLIHLQSLPWSNNFSHTLKQLTISRCPQILCIQLQRATMNMFGELVKLWVNEFPPSCPPEAYFYRLSSVVEHFGRVGSGHYTVYRSVRADSCIEDPDKHFETPSSHWFCISDSEVHSVSEKDVLTAEASLLFYERIIES
ncbi:ubiquitin carboxyl-terminal hydrolase 27 isoform X2 [Pistacia vera]|uniref:ubiquitin carboxyl-terminal hydrolase 27-like isoform X2 n=1 Tax=Pistacia vera TaxID=55513 RepID=UPI001263965A|nr:ubiquitin carboxyl-terminal hydrolase 27-like isoform X2 [Pistacia vera]XP_031282746.1 ubiquitin carboxyl-terminal hydrolase 27 isoform X2 [Pistacia vera]